MSSAIMSNMECSVLTKDTFEKAMADLMDEKKLAKRQKEQVQRSREASSVIARCLELCHDENTPGDIKGLVYGLAMSTAFNGVPICSKEIKDKLRAFTLRDIGE